MVTGVGTPSLVERIVYLVQVPPLPLPGCPTTFKTSSTPLSSREEYVNLVFTSSSTLFLILVVVTPRTSMFYATVDFAEKESILHLPTTIPQSQ